MAMSRKHYTEVAKIIKTERELAETFSDLSAKIAVKHSTNAIAEDLANFFKRDNAAFDRARFLDACGIETD